MNHFSPHSYVLQRERGAREREGVCKTVNTKIVEAVDYPNYHNNRRSDDLDLTTTAMMSLSLFLSLSSMMILMRIERWCYRHSSFLAQFSNGGVDSKIKSIDAILYATVDYLYIYLLVKFTSIIRSSHCFYDCVVSRLIDSRLRFAPIFVVVKDLCDLLCFVEDVFILTDFP